MSEARTEPVNLTIKNIPPGPLAKVVKWAQKTQGVNTPTASARTAIIRFAEQLDDDVNLKT